MSLPFKDDEVAMEEYLRWLNIACLVAAVAAAVVVFVLC